MYCKCNGHQVQGAWQSHTVDIRAGSLPGMHGCRQALQPHIIHIASPWPILQHFNSAKAVAAPLIPARSAEAVLLCSCRACACNSSHLLAAP